MTVKCVNCLKIILRSSVNVAPAYYCCMSKNVTEALGYIKLAVITSSVHLSLFLIETVSTDQNSDELSDVMTDGLFVFMQKPAALLGIILDRLQLMEQMTKTHSITTVIQPGTTLLPHNTTDTHTVVVVVVVVVVVAVAVAVAVVVVAVVVVEAVAVAVAVVVISSL